MKWNNLWPFLFLALGISGGLFQNVWPLYLLVFAICACIGLASFGKIESRLYLPIVFSMSLALLYQTTLQSPFVVGTDVHGEHYMAYLVRSTGSWDTSIPSAYNSSLSTTIFAPAISYILHIDLTWVFKAIYPFLLACVPPLLYLIWKNQFGQLPAFLAAFFFVSVPAFTLELVGISKQQVAEFFFVLALFLLLDKSFKLKFRFVWIMLAALLATVSHYSVGALGGVAIAGLCGVAILFRLLLPKMHFGVSIRYLVPLVAVLAFTGFAYYYTVADGEALRALRGSVSAMEQQLNPPEVVYVPDPLPVNPVTSTPGPTIVPTPVTPTPIPTTEPTVAPTPKPTPKPFYMFRQSPMIRAVTGMDFLDVSVSGKLFRVFQFATQAILIVGIVILFRRWRERSPAYLTLCAASCFLLLLTVFYPGFSPILNATRFYHLALIFLAPTIVLGGIWLFKRIGGARTLALGVLIPYFLFTSGLVFEVTKSDRTDVLDTPYSIALSGNRVDVGGILDPDDGPIRDYIIANSTYPVFADLYGTYFLGEKIDFIHLGYLTAEMDDIPSNAYVFLRNRNIERQELTYWIGIGLRDSFSFKSLKVPDLTLDRDIVFWSGKGILLSPEKEGGS